MTRSYIGPKTKNYKEKVDRILKKKKSLPALLKELQKVFNTFIRIRDTLYSNGTAYFICISCGKPKDLTQMNAGHYFSVGAHPSVRFDESNVHGQCIKCNLHEHSNEKKYRVNLIKKIGADKFRILELRSENRSKLMAFEVEILIQEYKDKIEKLTHY